MRGERGQGRQGRSWKTGESGVRGDRGIKGDRGEKEVRGDRGDHQPSITTIHTVCIRNQHVFPGSNQEMVDRGVFDGVPDVTES